MIPRLRSGKLAPVVERFVGDLIQEYSNLEPTPIKTLLEALKTCPVLGTVLDVQTLIALQLFGDYSHPEEEIQDFIQAELRNIDGSFQWSFSELYAATALGNTFSEIEWMRKGELWHLASLRAVDPRYYQYLGAKGRVQGIRYQSQTGQIDIPIGKGCHVINKRYLTFGDPYGVGNLQQAIAAWRAWKILMGQMLIAGQRQATGVVVGYAPSEDSVPLFNADGSPMLDDDGEQMFLPAPDALNQQLQGLENGSVVSTDLKNKIEMLDQQTDGEFFLSAIDLCEREMMMSFAFPNTILSTASAGSGLASGDSNLNEGHRSIMELTISSVVNQITEEILEKIVRPLIFWNFGEQEDYGEFKTEETEADNKIELMNALNNAVATGFFSPLDRDVINRGRELVGLPRTDEVIPPDTPGQESMRQLSKAVRNYWK